VPGAIIQVGVPRAADADSVSVSHKEETEMKYQNRVRNLAGALAAPLYPTC
jgi:hypothetical protein